MFNIAIVEDDENDAKLISSFIERYGSENGNAFKITRFANAITFLTGYNSVYDAVFIDIQMPHMDGMEAATRLRELDSSVLIVFITNMSNYAVKGYSVNATDFIVKPVQHSNFTAMMAKIIRLIENSAETVMIKSPSGRIKLRLDSIIYLEVIGHRVIYHTDNGDFTVWETLKAQEALLPKDRFAKCNNYCIINLKHVVGMIDNNVKLKNYLIPVSRSQKKSFDSKLLSFYGRYV